MLSYMFGSDEKVSKEVKADEEKYLTLMRNMVRNVIKQNVGRKLKKGGRHKEFDNVFGSNNYSFDSSGVYTFVNRVVILNGLVSSAGGVVALGIALNPTVPTQWSAQSSLFDEYRIDKVRLSFSPVNANTLEGFMSVALDEDAGQGATVPASQDVMLQYGNVWWGNTRALPGSWSGGSFVKPYTYRCAPPGQAVVSGVVTSTTVATTLGAWCDIANPSTSYQGIVFVRADDLSASAALATYVLEYVMQYRQVR